MPSRSNAKHQANPPRRARRGKTPIMQSGIRQSAPGFVNRDTALLRRLESGIYVRSSTCRCILPGMYVRRAFFLFLLLAQAKSRGFSQPAMRNREKSRDARIERIALRIDKIRERARLSLAADFITLAL